MHDLQITTTEKFPYQCNKVRQRTFLQTRLEVAMRLRQAAILDIYFAAS